MSAVGAISGPGEGLGQTLWFFSISVFCLGSLMTAINFIATVIDMRAPGMTLMRMPLTCWNWFVTAILSLLAFAVLLPAAMLILLDRLAGTSFFIPGGLLVGDMPIQHDGGSPLLWQHLFWFFGHPEVYIAILPGMGIVSHLIATFSRRPIFGYRAMVWSSVAIAFLGLLVWGHHMFISGLNPYSAIAFSLLTMVIGVPSAVKTLNWIATAWGGNLRLNTPMLFSLGFVSIFVTGGLSGLVLGQPQLDAYFHGHVFCSRPFSPDYGSRGAFRNLRRHPLLVPAPLRPHDGRPLGQMALLPDVRRRLYTVSAHAFAGFAGNPRRYSDFTTFDFLQQVMPIQRGITYAAYFLAAAQLIFLYNLFRSIWFGAVALQNPWGSTGIEWVPANRVPIVVYRGPYEFGGPNLVDRAGRDYAMQNEPLDISPCPEL